MTTARIGFKLSYKPDEYTEQSMFYESANNVTFLSSSETPPSSLCCPKKPAETYSGMANLNFDNDFQRKKFEEALKSNDLNSALNIAKAVEATWLIEEKAKFNEQPTRCFLEGYINHQEKRKKFNQGFFVKFGVRKEKPDTTKHEVITVAPKYL